MYRLLILAMIVSLFFMSGCSRGFAGGAALGAGAAGAAYEYSNKRALDNLEEDFRAGKITAEEYQRRKKEIEDRSLVY